MIEDRVATAIRAYVDAGELAGAAALVWRDGKAHILHRAHPAGLALEHPAPDRERLAEPVDLEDGHAAVSMA